MVSCENNKMLRFPLRHKPRKFKKSFGPGSGPAEREKRLQMIVTSLIRHERIEGNEGRLDETRQYAEEVSYVFATIYYADLRNYGYWSTRSFANSYFYQLALFSPSQPILYAFG